MNIAPETKKTLSSIVHKIQSEFGFKYKKYGINIT